MSLFAVITLGLASGYAFYVWSGEARASWRQHRHWKAIGYGMLGLVIVHRARQTSTQIIDHVRR